MAEQPSTTGPMRDADDRRPPRGLSLAPVWRARWLVVGAALVAGVGGYLVSRDQPPTYTAESQLVLSTSQDFEPLGGGSFGGDATRFVANQATILTTPRVLQAAVDELGDGTMLTELAESVSVSAAADSDVLVVEASAGDASQAAERANALTAGYRQYRAERVTAEVAAAVAATTDPAAAADIRAEAAVYGDGVALVDAAVPPDSPTAPQPLRTAALLAVLAALAATGLALVLGRRGPVSDAAVFIRAAGAPVLGAVPLARTAGRGPLVGAEEFALTAVALDFVRPEGGGPVMVTGATADSGATSVVQGLALAAAERGRTVLVVDAGGAGEVPFALLGGATPPGTLDELATGRAEPTEVVTQLPAVRGRSVIRVAVLARAAGPGLDEASVARALELASSECDLVLVSGGPLTRSSAAFALLRQAGAVVAVVGVAEDPSVLAGVRDRLETAGCPLTGVVVTRPAPAGRKAGSRRHRAGGQTPGLSPEGARAAG